jgi:phospholipase D1/2
VGQPNSFPIRENCSVDLFHDAAVDPHLPALVDENGHQISYRAGECWCTIYHAMCKAKKFIYITGWSVDTTQSLLRTTRQQQEAGRVVSDDETIGELLARKVKEGCRVLVHIWDEKTSTKRKQSGMMSTHDEQTFAFLNSNGVHCVKSYREGYSADTSFIFTHHQKTIILDAPVIPLPTANTQPAKEHHHHFPRIHLHRHEEPKAAPLPSHSNRRRIIAFVGGLDLCDGRWDTPNHSLFRTLAHEHAKDFHNPWPVSAETGPREPWHDIHSKV